MSTISYDKLLRREVMHDHDLPTNKYVNITGDTMTGPLLLQPSSDSVSVLQVKNQAGTSTVLSVDTSNGRIGVGTASPSQALDVNGNINLTGVMPNIRDSILRSSKLGIFVELDSGFTATKTGSGDVWNGKLNTNVLTGTTNGSTAGYVAWWGTWHQTDSSASRWKWSCRIQGVNATDKMAYWVGFFADTTTFPTGTSNHYGFKWVSSTDGVSGDLYATNGDGTETSTLLVSAIPASTSFYICASYEQNIIKYYYSSDNVTWQLLASHSTHIPTATSLFFGSWITNSEAVDKRVEILGVRLFEGD